jgi:hypothetical protein
MHVNRCEFVDREAEREHLDRAAECHFSHEAKLPCPEVVKTISGKY